MKKTWVAKTKVAPVKFTKWFLLKYETFINDLYKVVGLGEICGKLEEMCSELRCGEFDK